MCRMWQYALALSLPALQYDTIFHFALGLVASWSPPVATLCAGVSQRGPVLYRQRRRNNLLLVSVHAMCTRSWLQVERGGAARFRP